MTDFTPLPSLIGGLLIGLSVSLLFLGSGRVAGISGVLGGLLGSAPGERSWRALFLAGLLAGGLAMRFLAPASFFGVAMSGHRSVLLLVAGGLLVGFGTRLGGGCTSGHGVCGLSRLSTRSLAATLTFMATGALTVYVARHLVGAA